MNKLQRVSQKDFESFPERQGTYEEYLQRVNAMNVKSKETTGFDFINQLYTTSIVGGGGGTSESITFNIGAIQKTTGRSSKKDYSKRSISQYLISEYGLYGKELIDIT